MVASSSSSDSFISAKALSSTWSVANSPISRRTSRPLIVIGRDRDKAMIRQSSLKWKQLLGTFHSLR